jgi:tRNA threonylcarbamoyladenosine biosynthesis protein TsaB
LNPVVDIDTEISVAIETSGRIGSVAVGRGDTLLAEAGFSGFMKQAAELFPQICTLLDEAGTCAAAIQQVIITAGPGSFTGLRIAVTVAKMLYLAQQARIVAVDSTDVIAENAPDCADDDPTKPVDCVCTILDAKRNQFYASVFERRSTGWTKLFGTETLTAEALLERLGRLKEEKVYLLGEGLVYYADKFEAPFTAILDETYWVPTSGGLFRVGRRLAGRGQFADPMALTPFYIRQPDAIEKYPNSPGPV